ncbi:unnamed protein product [Meloidogyne enterolobii]|uniref:Uncharacterized protein n=1 Tax=Meloidogyne enterolobii TaxID=390850 RepID=A0ACB0XPM0_MELEN
MKGLARAVSVTGSRFDEVLIDTTAPLPIIQADDPLPHPDTNTRVVVDLTHHPKPYRNSMKILDVEDAIF